MRDAPDVVSLRLSDGQVRLKEYGFLFGEIRVTEAPGTDPGHNLRIVKQQTRPDGRVDLVVVYDLASFPGKEV